MLLMRTFGQPAVIAIHCRSGTCLQYAIGSPFLVTGGYLFDYGPVNFAGQSASVGTFPVVRFIEGSPGSASPYTPAVLHIPADWNVAMDLTDNIGGCCGLVTVFPGLGVSGGTVRVLVPVGQTRQIVIRPPRLGRHRYHCSGACSSARPAARGSFIAVPEPLGLIYLRCEAAINGQDTLSWCARHSLPSFDSAASMRFKSARLARGRSVARRPARLPRCNDWCTSVSSAVEPGPGRSRTAAAPSAAVPCAANSELFLHWPRPPRRMRRWSGSRGRSCNLTP